MTRSGMFNGEDSVERVRRKGEKMLYECVGNVYFIQNGAKLMGTGCAVLERFADLVRFPKKLFKSTGIPANYGRLALLTFL